MDSIYIAHLLFPGSFFDPDLLSIIGNHISVIELPASPGFCLLIDLYFSILDRILGFYPVFYQIRGFQCLAKLNIFFSLI